MRVLLTRPEPGATRTATRLAALGHRAVVEPLLEIETLAPPLPAVVPDAFAFTSPNGVEAYAGPVEDRPLFAVGPRTADAARGRGWRDVRDCAGDAQAVVRHIAQALPAGARVRHPAGADQAADLATLLAPHGIGVDMLLTYRAVAATRLSADTAAQLRGGGLDAALHFSPRSARTLLACAQAGELTDALRGLRHFCLSPAIAAVLSAAGIAARVAQAPNEDALIALLADDGDGAPEVAP